MSLVVIAVRHPGIFGGAADFDLQLIESRTLDGHIYELIHRPALHVETFASGRCNTRITGRAVPVTVSVTRRAPRWQ